MLLQRIRSKFILLLTIMVASLSLTSMSKVSAVCKAEDIETIKEKMEEYAGITEHEAGLTIRYARVAQKEKAIGRIMKASLHLDVARKFEQSTKNALVEIKNLVREVRTKRTQNALFRIVQVTICAEREFSIAEVMLSVSEYEVESSIIQAS